MHQEKKMLAHISEDGTRVQTVADHLQGTAVLCGKFAAAFDAQQQGTWLGLLHDIGKYTGESHGHEISGYNYLKDKGYDEEYCNICITHSYLNNDIICTAGGVPNPQDKPSIAEFVKTHKYTIEEKLINLCDLMCPQGGKVFTIDKRLIDIMIRRGAYSNTQYHIKETYKLKEYFDGLLGYNFYDLFPEIKENL